VEFHFPGASRARFAPISSARIRRPRPANRSADLQGLSSIIGLIGLAVLVIGGPQTRAQSSNAQLSGVITDTSGAVVPGADFNALNTANNVTYSAVS
jgi:hypothetical protein